MPSPTIGTTASTGRDRPPRHEPSTGARQGHLLLHDIHAVTLAALPELLKKLKEEGFHVVHVVRAAADRIETAGASRMSDRSNPNWPNITVAPPPIARVAGTGRNVLSHRLTSRAPHHARGPPGKRRLSRCRRAKEWPNFSGASTPPASPQAELPAPARQD